MKREQLHAWLNEVWEQTRYNTIPFIAPPPPKPRLVLTDDELILLDMLCEGEQTMQALRKAINKSHTVTRVKMQRFEDAGWVRGTRNEVQGGTLRFWITPLGREVARTPCDAPFVMSIRGKRRLYPERRRGSAS